MPISMNSPDKGPKSVWIVLDREEDPDSVRDREEEDTDSVFYWGEEDTDSVPDPKVFTRTIVFRPPTEREVALQLLQGAGEKEADFTDRVQEALNSGTLTVHVYRLRSGEVGISCGQDPLDGVTDFKVLQQHPNETDRIFALRLADEVRRMSRGKSGSLMARIVESR